MLFKSVTMKICLTFALVLVIPFRVLAENVANVGDTLCVEGYPMDYYCIQDGFLFDNPSLVTLEGAEMHTVHCLIDAPPCIASPFEILTSPATGEKQYTRAYRLDEATKAILVDLAKKSGDCDDCEGTGTIERGLKVVVQGVVTATANGETPAIVSGSVSLADPDSLGCSATVPAAAPAGSPMAMNSTATTPVMAPTTSSNEVSSFDTFTASILSILVGFGGLAL